MKSKKIAAGVLSLVLAAGAAIAPFGEFADLTASAESTTFEAENTVTSGNVVDKPGYSGGKAVEMKEQNLEFKINIPSDGYYNFSLTTEGNGGDKQNTLKINGSTIGSVSSKGGSAQDYTVKNIRLNAGENVITIEKSWGYIFIDKFEIEKVENYDPNAQYTVKKALSNPKATNETKRLYEYICDNFGQKVLSGQQEGCGSNKDYEMEYLKNTTGKLPAVRGLDFMNNDFDGVVERAKNWWDNGKGIVTICWHTGVESSGYGEAKAENPDFSKLLNKNSTEHKKMIASWDKATAALAQLQDAKVPVLWRPFHEFDGQWFWWGKGDKENFKKLWQEMYDYFTNEKGLNNLIWVLGYADNVKDDWYVGDNYCDIIGSDTYNGGTNKTAWDRLIGLGTQKPVAFPECGHIPTVQEMENDNDKWSWFMCWHSTSDPDWLKTKNTTEDLKNTYNSDLVITKDELPDLRTYGETGPVISLNGKINVQLGGKAKISATTLNADGKKIQWKSSDDSICKVDQNGKVTALKPGTATITAKISGTNATDTCKVIVNDYALTLDSENVKIKAGKTYYLETETDCKDGVEWKSSAPSICKVDSNGKLTALKVGTAVITAKLKKHTTTAKCTVTVYDKSTISISKKTLSLKTGAKTKLSASTESLAGVVWSSSNKKVCTIDQKGNVKAISSGKAKITAKLKSNGKAVSCTITVTSPASKTVTGLKKVAVTSKSAKFSWKKSSGATGYQVWLYSGGKWKLKKNLSSNAYTITKLSPRKSYAVRVRAYKKVSGKTVYGKFSSTLKFRTK